MFYYIYECSENQGVMRRGLLEVEFNSGIALRGLTCFEGQESGKFKVQFFVGSSVVNIPACI